MTKRKARKRDYAAEYRQRLERAKQLGYSRDVARGHAKKGTLSIRVARSLKLPPGTSVDDVQLKPTGRSVDETTVDREQQALLRLGFETAVINRIDFYDEEAFIKAMLDLGFTSKEAYTLRFSP